MFFFLSKILEFFIYPLTWVLALSIAALLARKPVVKKRLALTSLIVLLIFTSPFLINRFARQWDIQPVPLKTSGSYSCAIVLGGFSFEGMHGKNGFFNTSGDRFIQALKLYTTGKVTHILVTGGNGYLIHDHFQESDWVKTQLEEFKVPDSCILTEDMSRNTIENAAFIKPILQKSGLQPPYLLVTSAFHMRRSLGIFKKTGIPVIPYPCNYLAGTSPSGIGDLIPDGGSLSIWNFYIKEFVGTIVNRLKG